MRCDRRQFLAGTSALALSSTLGTSRGAARARPNVLWIVVEDMSAHFSCYGETTIATPRVDRLAAEGLRFTNAITTGPVCSACRSALITGCYQQAIGAHHHRSGRGELKLTLPDPVRPVPELFGAAGYQVLNLNLAQFLRADDEARTAPQVGVAKTDYNFTTAPNLFDRVHWSQRPHGRPFFCQVQLNGGKYRGHGNAAKWPERVVQTLGSRTAAEAVTLPPDLPDDPVIREDWAQYLDCVRVTDHEVGRIVDRLSAAGLLDETLIFFLTDHGISHVRHKQFCYEGGVHVPLVVRGPGVAAGTVRTDVVEQIDLAACSLAAAGIEVPEWLQGRDCLGDGYTPRRYAFSGRDRCDETVDRIRCVRTERYKYLRNFYPQRPYLQPNAYKDAKPIVQALRRLGAEGKLTPAQALILAETRPAEELYDLTADPFELRNLAADPASRPMLEELRAELDRWLVAAPDRGPESWARYDSDMAVYLQGTQGAALEELQGNIALMKRYAAEGR